MMTLKSIKDYGTESYHDKKGYLGNANDVRLHSVVFLIFIYDLRIYQSVFTLITNIELVNGLRFGGKL